MPKASLVHRYHDKVMPRGAAFFRKDIAQARKNQAQNIRALRNQVGRKRAKATLHATIGAHVKGARERVAAMAVQRAKHHANEAAKKAANYKFRGVAMTPRIKSYAMFLKRQGKRPQKS